MKGVQKKVILIGIQTFPLLVRLIKATLCCFLPQNDNFNIIFLTIRWIVTGTIAPLPLTQCAWLGGCGAVYLVTVQTGQAVLASGCQQATKITGYIVLHRACRGRYVNTRGAISPFTNQ